MFRRALIVALCPAFMGLLPAAAGDGKGKAVEVVQKRLGELKAPQAKLEAVKDAALAKAFPGVEFVAVHFRLWPVAIAPPEPLRSQNLFAVAKDGKLHHFTNAKGLEAFARQAFAPAQNDEGGRAAVKAWLLLSQQFVQDGFYKFKLNEQSLLVGPSTRSPNVYLASATLDVVPEGGNKGTLAASLEFDKAGKLTAVVEENKVVRGMRPRCQATRLLDPDPVVRAICEDSLLVLGRLAHDYLMEQRQAAGPELRQAIDRIWKRIVDEGR